MCVGNHLDTLDPHGVQWPNLKGFLREYPKVKMGPGDSGSWPSWGCTASFAFCATNDV